MEAADVTTHNGTWRPSSGCKLSFQYAAPAILLYEAHPQQ